MSTAAGWSGPRSDPSTAVCSSESGPTLRHPSGFRPWRSSMREPAPREPAPLYPVSRRHLEVLTDEVGIMQHAIGSRPNPAHGYCTDDVARALQVDLLHGRELGWAGVADSAWRNMRFLEEAFDVTVGVFRNFRRVDGSWHDGPGSEDCQGRAMLALGEAIAEAPDGGMIETAASLFAQALPAAQELAAPRARASALLRFDAAMRPPPPGRPPPLALPAPPGAALAVAGIPPDVRERPPGPGADRRRRVSRLATDGRCQSGPPPLAHRGPDRPGGSPLADRQRVVATRRREGSLRPAAHRGDGTPARRRVDLPADRRRSISNRGGARLCLVPGPE